MTNFFETLKIVDLSSKSTFLGLLFSRLNRFNSFVEYSLGQEAHASCVPASPGEPALFPTCLVYPSCMLLSLLSTFDPRIFRKSIAFSDAPGREADSQPICQSVRQAVSQAVGQASRQADRQAETHSLAFFQLRTTSKNSGESGSNRSNRRLRGRTVFACRMPSVPIPAIADPLFFFT